jgi:hypothetical protein
MTDQAAPPIKQAQTDDEAETSDGRGNGVQTMTVVWAPGKFLFILSLFSN